MRGIPYGLRPCKVRNLSNSTVQKRGIVGNDPCVVPCRSNVTYRLTKECLTQVRLPACQPGAKRNNMRGIPYGLRPCKVRNLSNSTVQKRGIVGNDPCVVPCRSNVAYQLTKERLTQVRLRARLADGKRNNMRGIPYGLRPCKVRNLSNSTVQKRGILERRGSLPPSLPLSPRTFPKSTRPGRAKIWFVLHGAGALGGSFLFRAEGGNTLESAASRPICGWCSGILSYTSAEIPPVGAPSGFDSAAIFDSIA